MVEGSEKYEDLYEETKMRVACYMTHSESAEKDKDSLEKGIPERRQIYQE